MMEYTIKKYTETLTKIYITEPNKRCETLMMEIHECTNPGGKMHFLIYGIRQDTRIKF